MRRRLPFGLALGAALCGTLLARGAFDRGPLLVHADEPATRAQGVAVLELFTSQGCSSCPPADR